jgi:hypothetical protein
MEVVEDYGCDGEGVVGIGVGVGVGGGGIGSRRYMGSRVSRRGRGCVRDRRRRRGRHIP